MEKTLIMNYLIYSKSSILYNLRFYQWWAYALQSTKRLEIHGSNRFPSFVSFTSEHSHTHMLRILRIPCNSIKQNKQEKK